MADMRASSFLPTIKCSMCARDIQISQMGDHVCGGSGEPTPPPESFGNFDRMYKQAPANGPAFLKPGKSLPPRVDTSAANRPYLPQGQLTPVSASSSRSLSSFSGQDGKRSPNPFAKPLRSATLPIPRAPPSPELLSSNLDCAFPPFPISKPTASKAPVASGYGGFGNKNADAKTMNAPLSPRTMGPGNPLQRMHTTPIVPSESNARRNFTSPEPIRGHRRQATSDGTKGVSGLSGVTGGSAERPSTAEPSHSRGSMNSSNGSGSEAPPPRMLRKNGYGGFEAPGDDVERLSSESRSKTFPLTSQANQGLPRRPSVAQNTSFPAQPSDDFNSLARDREQRGPNGSPPQKRNPSTGPDRSRPLPPRGASLIRPRADVRLAGAPPVPSANVNLAAEFGIGNPYHTPSESQSSDNSGYSEESPPSSKSSPPRKSRRQGSDTSRIDVLMANLASMSDLQTTGFTTSSPPRNNNNNNARPIRNPDASLLPIDGPVDPAIQPGRMSPLPHPDRRGNNPSRSLSPFRPDPDQRPSMRRTATNVPSARRPSASAPKYNCKHCSLPIRGKSISSADGRLTGRYHKECFSCTTCSEPFATSTFYVINDAPYCETHYHKLNGSVCSTCDKGIEGQYLESEQKLKFHPQCLACSDCKRVLKNDYFEMGGRVYCERDAFRRAQQGRARGGAGMGGGLLGAGMGGASNRMERRTTKLMMM